MLTFLQYVLKQTWENCFCLDITPNGKHIFVLAWTYEGLAYSLDLCFFLIPIFFLNPIILPWCDLWSMIIHIQKAGLSALIMLKWVRACCEIDFLMLVTQVRNLQITRIVDLESPVVVSAWNTFQNTDF